MNRVGRLIAVSLAHGLFALVLFALPACSVVFAQFEFVSSNAVTEGANSKPNIILIISDDQAWADYGFMGHEEVRTPHLDRLAEESLLFRRGYVAAPICRPSLACMVTGLYPFQHGVTGNDVELGGKRAALDRDLRKRFYEHPNLVQLLSDNGYETFQSGKWWEGSWKDGGFTDGMTHGDPSRGGRHGDDGLSIGRKGLGPVTDFVDQALAKEKPFLVWYAPFLPHTPHNPPQRLLKKYSVEGRSPGLAKYYAMCEWFDETCGELVGHLEQRDVRKNTLIIYVCDNGWAEASTNAEDPTQKLWKRYAQRSKGSPFENGIRSPIMVSWPDKLRPEDSPALAHSTDLFPTIVAAAGLKPPKSLPGINLLDEQARKSRKQVFGVVHSTHNISTDNPDETLQYLWCIESKWKLIQRFDGIDKTHYRNLHNWDTKKFRLYDLSNDPGEKSNLANENPEVVRRLAKSIKDWREGFEQTDEADQEQKTRELVEQLVYAKEPAKNRPIINPNMRIVDGEGKTKRVGGESDEAEAQRQRFNNCQKAFAKLMELKGDAIPILVEHLDDERQSINFRNHYKGNSVGDACYWNIYFQLQDQPRGYSRYGYSRVGRDGKSHAKPYWEGTPFDEAGGVKDWLKENNNLNYVEKQIKCLRWLLQREKQIGAADAESYFINILPLEVQILKRRQENGEPVGDELRHMVKVLDEKLVDQIPKELLPNK